MKKHEEHEEPHVTESSAWRGQDQRQPRTTRMNADKNNKLIGISAQRSVRRDPSKAVAVVVALGVAVLPPLRFFPSFLSRLLENVKQAGSGRGVMKLPAPLGALGLTGLFMSFSLLHVLPTRPLESR
jgi:hypothetical protein